jgi:hypothetical protein
MWSSSTPASRASSPTLFVLTTERLKDAEDADHAGGGEGLRSPFDTHVLLAINLPPMSHTQQVEDAFRRSKS